MKSPVHPSRRPSFLPLFCGLALPLLATTASVRAQLPGDQDAAFATGPGSGGAVHALALQGNGQVLVGGSFTTFRGAARSSVARVNADGSLDSFNPGLALTDNGLTARVYALGLQSDGKVIAAGEFSVLNQDTGGGVVRLNTDGSLDATFDVGSGVYDDDGIVGHGSAVAVLPNGQILVGGEFTSFNGYPLAGLVRLNADGSVDTSFNAGGSGITGNDYGNDVRSIVVLSNGQILIGGYFSAYNGLTEGGVARLNADGSLDTNFQSGQGPDYGVYGLGVQADGRVLACGGFNNFDGANIASHLVRLNTDGSLDTGYIPGLSDFYIGEIDALLVQPDGTVLIAGGFRNNGGLLTTAAGGLLRLNADGSLDTSFDGSNGVGQGVALALQADGKALVAYDGDGDFYVGPGDVLRVYDVFPTPTVTVASAAKKVYESGSKGPATFIVDISQAPTSKLTVHYQLKGSAISGFDYAPVSGKVKIKPGHTSATISVYPYNEGINDGSVVTLKAVLLPGDGYTVGSPAAAKDKILDNN